LLSSKIISPDVLLNAGDLALPDLQAELTFLNNCQFIAMWSTLFRTQS